MFNNTPAKRKAGMKPGTQLNLNKTKEDWYYACEKYVKLNKSGNKISYRKFLESEASGSKFQYNKSTKQSLVYTDKSRANNF